MVPTNKKSAITFSASKPTAEFWSEKQQPLTQDYFYTKDGHHQLYRETYGDPMGKPVMVLHGGPGAQCLDEYVRFPEGYHVIMFDQRGAGRSLPDGGLDHNNTDLLIEDIKDMILDLGYERVMLYGGSWGSNLAVQFAKKYPEMVDEIIVCAVWIACQETGNEIFNGVGPHATFDEYYAQFIAYSGLERDAFSSNEQFQAAVAEFYLKEATCGDRERELEAGRLFMSMDLLQGAPDESDSEARLKIVSTLLDAMRKVTIQFFSYCGRGFDRTHAEAIAGLEVLSDIPMTIVTGLSDMICAPYQAFELAELCPHSEHFVVEGAGHSGAHPGMALALYQAAERYLAQWKRSR